MINRKLYLQSIQQRCDRWWDNYTITDVVGKNHDKNLAKSLLFDLQALTIKPETIKPERELLPEAREEREILNVLEGLRKYAPEHVLLIGRPGSGKSTALVRLLVELRYYETSILDLITVFLHRHDPSLPIDTETIKTLLRQGQFFLLIDGVNELPSPEAQRNLQKFRQEDKQRAEETIRGISNQVNSGVGNVGNSNIGINIGTAGNVTFGDLSSGS